MSIYESPYVPQVFPKTSPYTWVLARSNFCRNHANENFSSEKEVGFLCQIPNVAAILCLLAGLLTCSDTGTYQIKQISVLENEWNLEITWSKPFL